MAILQRAERFASIPALLAAVVFALCGCDGSETPRPCAVLGTTRHSKSAPFLDRMSLATVAQFHIEQTTTDYETGDCEPPSTSSDGVRVLITNVAACTLDLTFSLSVFEGPEGWTVTGSARVEPARTVDTGMLITRYTPPLDQVQVLLTGSTVYSDCL